MKRGSIYAAAATTMLAAALPAWAEGPTLEFSIAKGSECVRPGELVEVQVRISNVKDDGPGAAGYQAFVEFKRSELTFVDGKYHNDHFGLPLLAIEESPNGIIGLAAGIDVFGGQKPMYGYADVATLFFAPKEEDCEVNIDFCRDCQQPNIITDLDAKPLDDLKISKSDFIAIDGTPPDITGCCPDVELKADKDCSALLPDLADEDCLKVSEKCVGYTVTQFPPAYTKLTLGTTTVTLIVTDCAGNESTCQTNVTVIDNEEPQIKTCPGDRLLKVDNDCTTRVPDFTKLAVFNDNCDNDTLLTIEQYPAPNTTIGLGSHVVEITATDNFGNVSKACEVKLEVIDARPPKIALCPNGHEIKADDKCEGILPNFLPQVVAVDNCTKPSNMTIEQDPPAGTELKGQGTTTVTITVRDEEGLEDKCSFPVTLFDSTPPVIEDCGPEVTLELDENCQAYLGDLTRDVKAYDNCSEDLEIIQSKAEGTQLLGQGVFYIDITVKDDKKNESYCKVKVTTVDNVAPVITDCSNDVKIKGGPDCEIKIPQLSVKAYDNCSQTLTIEQDPPAGTVFKGKQEIEVELTVYDEKMNSSSCKAMVIVEDSEAPTIVCPENMVVECTDEDGAWVDFKVDAYDNCDNDVKVDCYILNENGEYGDPINPEGKGGKGKGEGFHFPNKSRTFVVCVATDNWGNYSECIFSVAVQDLTAPKIDCPGDIKLEADKDCKGVVEDITHLADVSDNCDEKPIVWQKPPAGSSFNGQGNYIITLHAADNSGNESSCKVNVTVVDETPPVVDCPNGLELKVDHYCQVQVPDITFGVKAYDNCAEKLTIVQYPAAGTMISLDDLIDDGVANEGWLEIEVTVTDEKGNSEKCTTPVQVIDSTPPKVLNCPEDFTLEVDDECTACIDPLKPEKFQDNCTEESVWEETEIFDKEGKSIGYAPICVTKGTYYAETRLFDKAGLYDTCVTHITVIDTTPPVVSCPDDQKLKAELDICAAYTDPGEATAKDNCQVVKISGKRSDGLELDEAYPLGETTIEWKAEDKSGNLGFCYQTITVEDNEAPIISCPPNIYVNADPGECTAKLDPGQATARDNCDSDVKIEYDRKDENGMSLPLDALYAGTNTITWTAKDDAGNESTCKQTIVVSAFNTVEVDIEFAKKVDNGPFTRCIEFAFYTCPDDEPDEVLHELVTFVNGEAKSLQLKVKCGDYGCVTAVDPLHSLRRTIKEITLNDKKNYEVNFTGDNALVLGNLNGDDIVDILDWAAFAGQFLQVGSKDTYCQNVAGAEVHADLNGNGIVFVEDHSIIAANFRHKADQPCCVHPDGGLADAGGPLTSITVEELAQRGLGHLAVADLNDDGVVDEADMEALANGVQPVSARRFAAENGSWFDAANWDGNTPNANTNVTLAGNVMIDQDGAMANTLTVEANGSLAISQGSLSASVVSIDAGAALQLDDAMALLQVDSLALEQGADFQWTAGTIEVDGGLFSSADALLIGAEGEAIMSLLNDATVSVPSLFVGMFGQLEGTGLIESDLTNDGLIRAEYMTVAGNFTQSAIGETSVELNGLGNGQLQVAGDAYLNGTLSVSLADGFSPQNGDQFEIVAASTLNGEFAQIELPQLTGNLKFEAVYGADSITVQVVTENQTTNSQR